MKSTIYNVKNRENQSLELTKNSFSQSNNLQRECRQMEQEILIIEEEIKELTNENNLLEIEISKIMKKK